MTDNGFLTFPEWLQAETRAGRISKDTSRLARDLWLQFEEECSLAPNAFTPQQREILEASVRAACESTAALKRAFP